MKNSSCFNYKNATKSPNKCEQGQRRVTCIRCKNPIDVVACAVKLEVAGKEKKYWTSRLESEEEIDAAVDDLFSGCSELMEEKSENKKKGGK